MKPSPIPVHEQELMASLIAGVGLIWAAYTWSSDYWGFRALELTAGPLDVCNLGILIWLTAKWRAVRQSVAANHVVAALPQ